MVDYVNSIVFLLYWMFQHQITSVDGCKCVEQTVGLVSRPPPQRQATRIHNMNIEHVDVYLSTLHIRVNGWMDSIWIQIEWRFVAYIGGGWVNSLHQAFSRFGWDFWSGWWWLREHQILHESLYRSECICATQKLVDWVMRCWRLITLTTYRNWILENNNGRERKRFPYSISFSNHAPLMLFAVCEACK